MSALPASRRAVTEHYGKASYGYTAFRDRGVAGFVRRREQRAVLGLLTAESGQLVLDVGCGDGAIAGLLVERGVGAVAVDLALPMARLARGRGAAAVVADMVALGVVPCFDWVACIGSLEFVTHPEKVVRGFASCLRPGGRLVLLAPRRSLAGLALRAYHRRLGIAISLWSRRRLTALVSCSGFGKPDGWRRCAAAWVCRATVDSGSPKGDR